MMQQPPFRPRGFTLSELFTVLVILSVTAVLLYPVVETAANEPVRRETLRQEQCMSNLQQIGIAVLAYAQDYDATLPPAVRYTYSEPQASKPATVVAGLFWTGAVDYRSPFSKTPPFLAAYLTYFKGYRPNSEKYKCPAGTPATLALSYLTNDLAGGTTLTAFTNPAATILMMDGESDFPTVGHACDANAMPRPYGPDEHRVTSSEVRRHNGGADYLLGDGHVKWLRPDGVFFPPRESTSPEHYDRAHNKITGPNPGGTMDLAGVPFQATFHLR